MKNLSNKPYWRGRLKAIIYATNSRFHRVWNCPVAAVAPTGEEFAEFSYGFDSIEEFVSEWERFIDGYVDYSKFLFAQNMKEGIRNPGRLEYKENPPVIFWSGSPEINKMDEGRYKYSFYGTFLISRKPVLQENLPESERYLPPAGQ